MGLFLPQIEPAHMFHTGIIVTKDGILVSTVFRGTDSCGIILYRIADGTCIRFPFTDEYRFGNLYSVKIAPLQASEWCYQLYNGSTSFIDLPIRCRNRVRRKDHTGRRFLLCAG